MQQNKFHNIALLFYLIISLFPVIFLLVTGKSEINSFNMRRAGLMMNSVLIAALTAMVCITISTFAALRIQTIFKKDSLLKWFFLLLAPMPSYIYALSYMNLIRILGKIFPEVLRSRAAGIFPCVFVESMVFLPFVMAAAVTGLDQAENSEWSAALLFTDADNAFFKVALPKMLPFSMAMGAVIFVLSITDYAIPSLFQVNVYSMEIFSDYSAAGQSVHSLMLALPLIIISSLVILFSLAGFGNISRPMKTDMNIKPEYSKKLLRLGNICLAAVFLQIILPLISMMLSLSGMTDDYLSAWEELSYSCISGIIAVLLAIVPAAFTAMAISKLKSGRRSVFMGLALLPLSVPGVLSGIGVLKFFSDTPLYPLRSSFIFPAAGMAIRYLPFSMLIQYGCYLRLDWDKIRAAKLLEAKTGIGFFRVTLPLMAPGLFISSIVVFLLTLGDVGTALMLMIAGREPLSVKIYNYLHYGASETVTAFCLVQMLVCLAVMMILYLMIVKKKRKK